MNQNSIKLLWWHWVVIILFVLWLAFSLAAYYVVQKPVDPTTLPIINNQLSSWQSFSFSGAAIWNAFLDAAAALWIAFVALGVGLWVWRWIGLQDSRQLDKFLFSEGIGIGFLGLFVLLLGLMGWLNATLLWGLMIVLTLASLPIIVPFSKTVSLKRPSALVTVFFILMTGLAFTVALLPPTSWDSLSYHLYGPRIYLDAGRIYPGVDVYSLNNPFLLEMVFLLSMAIRSDIAAQLMHFIFIFLLSGMVYTIAVNGLKLTQGWTAVLLLFTIPMLFMLAPWAYNDLALAFVTLAALYAYTAWQENEDTRWLVQSGIFSGFAMGFKYTSFIVPVTIGLLILRKTYRQPKRLLRYWLIFGGVALLIGIVWYAKNLVFTGNPFYPYAFDNGRFWDEFRANSHAGSGTGLGFDLIAILKTPFDITLGINDASGDGLAGPLFLAFLPVVILYGLSSLRRRTPPIFNVLLIYITASYAFWLVGVIFSNNLFQGRLLLPVFAALCPMIAWIIDDIKFIDHPQFSLHRFINLVLAFVLMLSLINHINQWLVQNPLPYVLGTQTREDYLERTLGTLFVASEAINEQLPSETAVQFLWEPRNYYCHKTCRGDTLLDKYSHLEYLHQEPDKIAQAFVEEGVTHLLVFELGRKFLVDTDAAWVTPVHLEKYQLFIENHTNPVQSWNDNYILYEIVP